MKKITIYLAAFTMAVASNAQIEMNASGNVGIGGSTPSSTHKLTTTKLYVPSSLGYYSYLSGIRISKEETEEEAMPSVWPNSNAFGMLGLSNKAFLDVYAYNFIDLSDKRKKENIRSVSGNLAKVLKLDVVKYDYKAEVFLNENDTTQEHIKNVDKIRKEKIGLLAQDVQKIIPEVVKYDKKRDLYGIDYTELVPILIAALQEQQVEIEQLKKKTKTAPSNNAKETEQLNNATGGQLLPNFPNPFDENTEIRYTLPEGTNSAQMFIYDFNGIQLRSMNLTESSSGKVTIEGRELKPGIYHYALVADGELIETRKMILTE